MERLRDAIDAERNRFFMGRRAEIGRLADWLQAAAAPTQIVSITGMGGIGKSALLQEMLRIAAGSGAATLWMDGRACVRSPAGFLEYLDTVLARLPVDPPGAAEPGDPLSRLADAVTGGRRIVLAVDNYEDIAHLEGWLREDFFGRLPDRGVLAVLASRQGLSPAWSADPAWRWRIVELPLSPFTRAESRAYLARLDLSDVAAGEALIREAGGHPLALALGADLLERQPEMSPRNVSQAIGVHLLHEVAAPDLHPLMEALAVLPEGNQELLSRVLGEPVSPDRYHTLARLSFVRPSEQGLALHDVARAHLLADLRRRAPDRFRLLRRSAVAALHARLAANADRRERRRIAAHLLAVCRDALPVHSWFADLAVAVEVPAPTPCRPEDRPLLHEILTQWAPHAMGLTEVDDERGLLDALCDRFPESVRVVRSAQGEPLGFMAIVLLHQETAALLERHRTGALYLKRCPPDERAALNCPPETANTYYACLAGYNPNNSTGYSPKESAGVAFHDFLAHLGEGTRLMGLAGNPEINAFVHRLGFRPRPECRATFGYAPWPFQVSELDMRQRDFGEWVVSFLDAVEDLASPHNPVAVRSPRTSPASADPAFVAELRSALNVINHPNRLQASPLARRLGRSGKELQGLLRDMLTGEIPPTPLTPGDQEVLRAAFLDGDRTPEAIAANLHLSRATYYRKLHAALAALAETLAEAFPGL